MPVPIEQVEDWYRALKTFHNLAQAPENLVKFKLQLGNTELTFLFFNCFFYLLFFFVIKMLTRSNGNFQQPADFTRPHSFW